LNQKKVLIAGGSGTLGSALTGYLLREGYNVHILTRQFNPGSAVPSYRWDPEEGFLEEGALDDVHAVINLTGQPLDAKRWTDKYKKILIKSRVEPAHFLNSAFHDRGQFPEVYIGASAVGFYGDTGDKWATEQDAGDPSAFVSQLVQKWESAHLEDSPPQTRTVILRFSPVLNMDAGFLKRLYDQAKFGLYASLGDGRQWQSWLHIDDLCRAIIFCLETSTPSNVFNVTAPGIVRQKEFMQQLKKAMGNFGLILPAPGFMLYIVLGEMAWTLLENDRVSSEAIRNAGFRFQFPELREALDDLLPG
jgi:hypothetical protein